MRRAWLGLAAVLVAGASFGAGGGPATSPPRPLTPAAPAACGKGGIEVTVALAYDIDTLGPIAGTYVDLGFRPPLDLPQAAEKLRARVTSVLPGVKVASPVRQSDHLRVAATTTEQRIQPEPLFK